MMGSRTTCLACAIVPIVGVIVGGLLVDACRKPAPQSAPPVASISSADPNAAAIERRDDAIRKCRSMGQVVALGFGFNGPSVVCLQAPSVAFELDPEWTKR